MKPYEITLDLKRNLHQVLVMKEGDANSRIIHVKITDNGKPFDVSANYILIKWRKPDNCVVYNITYTKLDNNTFGIVCTDQMLAVPGIAELEIVIYENETDEVASTMKHNISIEETVIGNKIIESSDEFGALNDMLSKNESLEKDLTELEERLEEGYAEMQETINEMGDLLIEHIDNKENPHNVTKEQLGLSEVENKNSETIRGEITKENVTDALGYTPYTPTEVDNKFSTLETNIDWKEAVETFDDIATTYPAPVDGWTVNVNDTDYTYRYNGVEWIPISANAIPLATSSMDGKMSATDKEKLDSIEDDANNYTHPTTSGNKHIPSGGSSGQILKWSADGEATWGGYEGTLSASDVSYNNVASELTSDNVQDVIDEVNNKWCNVPNVSTNDQTPTFTEESVTTALTSGEKLSVSLGKVAKAIKEFINHVATKATTSVLGHVKLTNSSSVTDSTGLALPATEKNAAIGGTLANQIAGKMDKSEALIITKSLSYRYTAPSKERLQLGVTSAASICPSGYTLIAKAIETVGSSNVQASFGTNEILTLYNYASTSISGTVYVRYTYAKTVNITT